MLDSEQKDKLYKALAQSQAEYPTIRVNRKAFKNEYADLYAILKHTYPILKKYGLAIKPWAGQINGEQWIGARLSHESGQWETNIYKFEADPCKNPNDQPSHKKQGALTYFNRNHIKDMLGVLISDDPEDDDGQSDHAPHIRIETITPEQLDQLYHILEDQKEITEQVLRRFSISSLSQLPRDKFLSTMDGIISLKQKRSELKK